MGIKDEEMTEELNHKYWLSTKGYYFKYRKDIYDENIIRATLYNSSDVRVDDVRKSEGYGSGEKTHHDIIDYFEARIQLQITPPQP